MDLTQYRNLDRDKRLAIWQRLEASPEFQILKAHFQEKSLTDVTDQDSREAFYFQAATRKGIDEVLNFPGKMLRQIEAVSKQA